MPSDLVRAALVRSSAATAALTCPSMSLMCPSMLMSSSTSLMSSTSSMSLWPAYQPRWCAHSMASLGIVPLPDRAGIAAVRVAGAVIHCCRPVRPPPGPPPGPLRRLPGPQPDHLPHEQGKGNGRQDPGDDPEPDRCARAHRNSRVRGGTPTIVPPDQARTINRQCVHVVINRAHNVTFWVPHPTTRRRRGHAGGCQWEFDGRFGLPRH